MAPSNPPDSKGFWITRKLHSFLPTRLELFILFLTFFLFVFSFFIGSLRYGYDFRYSDSKNNLAEARSVISLYKSKELSFPQPTHSGGSMATESGAHTLQSILTSYNGKTLHTDKTESEVYLNYLRRVPKSEVISRPKGNNFVCVVNTIEEFYRDQSDFSNCQGITEHEKPQGRGGGYVYCPANGLLRLNFFVKGEDLRTTDQLPVHLLYLEWGEWVEEQFRDDGNNLEKDWPVRW